MTIPANLWDDFKPQGTQGAVDVEADPLARLWDDFKPTHQAGSVQKQPGFWDYVQNVRHNSGLARRTREKMERGEELTDPTELEIARQIAISQQTGSGYDIAFKDFTQMFGKMFENVSGTIKQVREQMGGIGGAIKDDPTGFIGQLGIACCRWFR